MGNSRPRSLAFVMAWGWVYEKEAGDTSGVRGSWEGEGANDNR